MHYYKRCGTRSNDSEVKILPTQATFKQAPKAKMDDDKVQPGLFPGAE
jgi:hypothetical protein